MFYLKLLSTCLLLALAFTRCDYDGDLTPIESPTPTPTYTVSSVGLSGDTSIKNGSSKDYTVSVSVSRPPNSSGPEAKGTAKLEWSASALPGLDFGTAGGLLTSQSVTVPAGTGPSSTNVRFTLKCEAPPVPAALYSIRAGSDDTKRGFRFEGPPCAPNCGGPAPPACTGPNGCGGRFKPCFLPAGCGGSAPPACAANCGRTIQDSITLKVVFVDEFQRVTEGPERIQVSCVP